MIDEVLAVLLVEMNNHLRIGARGEDVSLRFQRQPQLGVLEQLSVADDGDCAIFVEDGLPPIAKANDAETAMGKADAWCDEEAIIVGPSVPQRIRHTLQHHSIRPSSAPKIDNASQAAHRRLLRAIVRRGLSARRRYPERAMQCRLV